MSISLLGGTKGGLFYCPKDQKVIVSTNARFLKDDYVINHKPKSKTILEELRGDRLGHTSSRRKSYDRFPNELKAKSVNYNETLQDKDAKL